MTPPLLRLASHADFPADRLTALPTNVATGPKMFVDQIDLVVAGIGECVPQGSLFAYLFRRFGSPNRGWDSYKEHSCYLLTTTHPNMLLQIVPYAGGDSHLSFTFMVPADVAQSVRDWDVRDRHAHHDAFLDWIVEGDLTPDWAQEACDALAQKGYPHLSNPKHPVLGPLVHMLRFVQWTAEREGAPNPFGQWLSDTQARFEALHPMPDLRYRHPDWTTWGGDDPLTPYATAIIDTLAALQRPVWVRDCAINPWGRVEDEDLLATEDEDEPFDDEEDLTKGTQDTSPPEASLARFWATNEVATSAGHATGDLGNHHPDLFGQLDGLVRKLGNGDTQTGLKKAIALLSGAKTADPTE